MHLEGSGTEVKNAGGKGGLIIPDISQPTLFNELICFTNYILVPLQVVVVVVDEWKRRKNVKRESRISGGGALFEKLLNAT